VGTGGIVLSRKRDGGNRTDPCQIQGLLYSDFLRYYNWLFISLSNNGFGAVFTFCLVFREKAGQSGFQDFQGDNCIRCLELFSLYSTLVAGDGREHSIQ